MKRFIFILLISQNSIISFGQTKPKLTLDETVNWIVEKFNAISVEVYSPWPNNITHYSYNKNFSFNKDNLSIDSTTATQGFTNVGTTPMIYYYISIPLKDVHKIEYHVNDKVSENPTLLIITLNKTISTQYSDGGIQYDNKAYISVDITSQVNILERIKKAFADVKTHFPTSVETY